MANIGKGSLIRFTLAVNPNTLGGKTLADQDVDFTVDFYAREKSGADIESYYTVKKEDATPGTGADEGSYYVVCDTSAIGLGKIYATLTVEYVDESTERTLKEIILLTSEHTVVPSMTGEVLDGRVVVSHAALADNVKISANAPSGAPASYRSAYFSVPAGSVLHVRTNPPVPFTEVFKGVITRNGDVLSPKTFGTQEATYEITENLQVGILSDTQNVQFVADIQTANGDGITIDYQGTCQCTATVSEVSGSYKVLWWSGNNSIAKVDSTGLVSGVATGSTIIYAIVVTEDWLVAAKEAFSVNVIRAL